MWMATYKDRLSHTRLLTRAPFGTYRRLQMPTGHMTDTDEWATHTHKTTYTHKVTHAPTTQSLSHTHTVSPKPADVPAGPSASCVPLSWRHWWWGCDRSGLCWRTGLQCPPAATSYCHRHRSSQWPEPGKYSTHWKTKRENINLSWVLRVS